MYYSLATTRFVMTKKPALFYKDIRFWLVLASLLFLVWMTVSTYPPN